MPTSAERPPGAVTTFVNAGELVVRFSGEVDLCLQPELAALTKRVLRHDGPVMVDAAEVTFCDATLARFLSDTIGQASVSVRAPSRLVREFLVLYGLVPQVRVVQDSRGQTSHGHLGG
jgi:anti-anti-sigma regulatory factor